MTWFNPPTTKKKQRAYLSALADLIERDAPHLVVHVAALRAMETHMYNRVPSRRGRAQSVPMTPQVKNNIRTLRAADPLLPQHIIGTCVGVNQGRVNETLIGVRR
jgi:hypothetical protein